uniref:Cytochrome b-c1 complex subunit 7 n=1 Tax=Salvator merianae TaxID=96440 RepID=A0A8D0BSB2_SALMN
MVLQCSWFNKLGLLQDDTLYESPDVTETLKRLPEDVYYERLFHIKRALDLSMKHLILPKEQWVKYDEDKPYLEPYHHSQLMVLLSLVAKCLQQEAWRTPAMQH